MRYFLIYLLVGSMTVHAKGGIEMCVNVLSTNISELVSKAKRERNLSENVLRVNIQGFSIDKIDAFKIANLGDQEFKAFTFRFAKSEIASPIPKSDRFQVVNDVNEGQDLFRDTMSEAFSDRLDFMPISEQRAAISEDPKAIKNGTFFKFISKTGKSVGVAFFLDVTYLEEKVRLLAWIWKDKLISDDDSKTFDEQVTLLFARSDLPIISSVKKQNIRSIKYHRKLGFKEQWLVYQFI